MNKQTQIILSVTIVLFLVVMYGLFNTTFLDESVDISQFDKYQEDERKDYKPIDYTEAVNLMDDVHTSKTLSEAEKSRKILNNAYAYAVNEGLSEEGIQRYLTEMKDLVANEELSPKFRAQALQALSTSYCGFSRDHRVPTLLYKDPIYAPYQVQGDPSQSGKNLLEWAFEMYPLAKSAVSIGHWYAKSALEDTYDPGTQKEFALAAYDWTVKAEELSAIEIEQTGGQYTDGSTYTRYLYWRAFNKAVLTMAGEWPGAEDDWDQAYQDLFANLQRSDLTADASQTDEFAALMYAYFLREITKDDAVADYYLNQSVDLFTNKYKNDLNRSFARYLLLHSQSQSNDIIWQIFEDALSRSPDLVKVLDYVKQNDKIDRDTKE